MIPTITLMATIPPMLLLILKGLLVLPPFSFVLSRVRSGKPKQPLTLSLLCNLPAKIQKQPACHFFTHAMPCARHALCNRRGFGGIPIPPNHTYGDGLGCFCINELLNLEECSRC
jgi:hypothetical protein